MDKKNNQNRPLRFSAKNENGNVTKKMYKSAVTSNINKTAKFLAVKGHCNECVVTCKSTYLGS